MYCVEGIFRIDFSQVFNRSWTILQCFVFQGYKILM